ncbi:MAG: TRAP transporter substrate-binding protein DctP, partial [Verrucomicrobia bacterium]|nr:TRAP transporter substrate-binding protein DctP [Verrucomicrobiota bacterium]
MKISPCRRLGHAFAALTLLALVLCPRVAVAQEPKLLRIAHQFAAGTAEEGDFRDRLTRKFAAEVEQRTEGQLNVAVYANNGLFRSDVQLPAMQHGLLDMTLVPLVYAAKEIPEVNLTLMPALVASYDAAARWKESAIGKDLSAALEAHNMKVLTWIWQAGGIVSRDKPVLLPADLKGKKIRGAGAQMDRLWKAAGGVIVNLPSEELSAARSEERRVG